MKIIALDLGDQWVGTAITDASRILARPLQTVTLKDLVSFLHELFSKETISTVVIGYPQTLRGTESEQTKKVLKLKDELAVHFPNHQWVLYDERLTSKQAQNLGKKGEKLEIHSKAAALILEGYLMRLKFQSDLENISNDDYIHE
mgnify:CR=1 FL=1